MDSFSTRAFIHPELFARNIDCSLHYMQTSHSSLFLFPSAVIAPLPHRLLHSHAEFIILLLPTQRLSATMSTARDIARHTTSNETRRREIQQHLAVALWLDRLDVNYGSMARTLIADGAWRRVQVHSIEHHRSFASLSSVLLPPCSSLVFSRSLHLVQLSARRSYSSSIYAIYHRPNAFNHAAMTCDAHLCIFLRTNKRDLVLQHPNLILTAVIILRDYRHTFIRCER